VTFDQIDDLEREDVLPQVVTYFVDHVVRHSGFCVLEGKPQRCGFGTENFAFVWRMVRKDLGVFKGSVPTINPLHSIRGSMGSWN